MEVISAGGLNDSRNKEEAKLSELMGGSEPQLSDY